MSAPQPAISATELNLSGSQGPVYGPLSFSTPARGLIFLRGRGGSGSTALALTLAGRMKPSSGTLEVLGQHKPAAIRQRVAIAGVEQIDTLDRDLRIRSILSEHRNWGRSWWKIPARADQDYYEHLCGQVFGERQLPPITHYISQLSALERILFRICLALHPSRQHAEMLIMDDLDQLREQEQRLELLHILGAIATDIPVLVTTVNEPPGAFASAHTITTHHQKEHP